MPRFDGTGPQGQGPLTGWGNGPCASQGAGPACGGRFGRRRGMCFGFGQRNTWNESETLEETEKALQEELKAVRKEIASRKKK